MNGIQKTVSDGLRYLSTKVADGAYGEGDEAFQDEDVAQAFLDDMHDEVLDKMEQLNPQETRAMAKPNPKSKYCVWKPDEDGIYDTECENRFEITEGSPRDNKFKFCPYCGKKIIEGT